MKVDLFVLRVLFAERFREGLALAVGVRVVERDIRFLSFKRPHGEAELNLELPFFVFLEKL